MKTHNLRRDPRVSLCVISDGFFGDWIQLDGTAGSCRCPKAMEPLVDYYRSVSGEHPDWDGKPRRHKATAGWSSASRRSGPAPTAPAEESRTPQQAVPGWVPGRRGSSVQISITVNGEARAHDVEPRTLLVQPVPLRGQCASGHEGRVRHVVVRGLHGAPRR